MDNGKKKILIVEDEEDVLKPLVYRLKKKGYEVLTASDGEIGLRQAHKTLPDLIILDLFLPKISGEEVCKSIRESENVKVERIPILMLTAKAAEADRVLGKVIGANAYMTKPFYVDDLMHEIERLLLSAENKDLFLTAQAEISMPASPTAETVHVPHHLLHQSFVFIGHFTIGNLSIAVCGVIVVSTSLAGLFCKLRGLSSNCTAICRSAQSCRCDTVIPYRLRCSLRAPPPTAPPDG